MQQNWKKLWKKYESMDTLVKNMTTFSIIYCRPSTTRYWNVNKFIILRVLYNKNKNISNKSTTKITISWLFQHRYSVYFVLKKTHNTRNFNVLIDTDIFNKKISDDFWTDLTPLFVVAQFDDANKRDNCKLREEIRTQTLANISEEAKVRHRLI